jgi:hypothetical protein
MDFISGSLNVDVAVWLLCCNAVFTSLTFNMEALCSSETFVSVYKSTRRFKPTEEINILIAVTV